MSVVHNIQYIYIYVVCALNKGRRTEIMECVLFLCVYVLCVCVCGWGKRLPLNTDVAGDRSDGPDEINK